MLAAIDWTALTELLEGRPAVLAAWAFGSSVIGRATPESDLDIGVLFTAPPSLDEWADLRADLQEALQIEEIDLVVLNGASVVLRFEAISGRRLVCRDPEAVAGFASLTAREYEDEMAFAARGLAWSVEQIRKN